MSKKQNVNRIKEMALIAVSLFFIFFPFHKDAMANTPDSPYPVDAYANITATIQYLDEYNPNAPVIHWATSGNTPVYYWVQVSEFSNFSSMIVNTGPVSGNPGQYSITSGLVVGRSYYYRVAVKDSYAWTGWVGQCATPFVYTPNASPSASNLGTAYDFCVSGTTMTFRWTYSDPDGDPQAAYQVQIYDGAALAIDSGKVFSGSSTYSTSALQFNKNYTWRLMVWDSRAVMNSASAWYSGPAFSTPVHAYPSSNFSWFPDLPIIGQDTLFMDASRAYGGATITSWSWTIPDADYISPATSASQNPQVRFTSEGNKIIRLRVTDSSGYSCYVDKALRAQLQLPCWKEISPH
jgi:hypothetical protein